MPQLNGGDDDLGANDELISSKMRVNKRRKYQRMFVGERSGRGENLL